MKERAQRSLAVIVVGATLLGWAKAKTAEAGTASASLSVSVRVQPRALLTVDSQPSSLVLTEGDVRRGYVDVPVASRVSVRTNSPNGYLIAFEVAPGPFKTIEVKRLGAVAQIGANGGWIAQPYPDSISSTMELFYRFLLAETALPGSYAWPVALSASSR